MMAYIYQVSLDIRPDQMSELEIGASLERVLGYLRTTLPSEPGYVTSRAMRSVEVRERATVVFSTVWETWEDLSGHRDSRLSEDKVLVEFGPHVTPQLVQTEIFEEIA